MHSQETVCQRHPAATNPDIRIMVQGLVSLPQLNNTPIEIQRGQRIITSDGLDAGLVAALIFNRQQQTFTHLLLCNLPKTAVYHQIPLTHITTATPHSLNLNLHSTQIAQQPIFDPQNPT